MIGAFTISTITQPNPTRLYTRLRIEWRMQAHEDSHKIVWLWHKEGENNYIIGIVIGNMIFISCSFFFLRSLGNQISVITRDLRETSFLLQRISLAIVRSNTMAILSASSQTYCAPYP